jgi:putative ABC transport system substrate-binding protein
MRRRELIALLGGAAMVWPLTLRAQPAKRPEPAERAPQLGLRIGVLMGIAQNDPGARRRIMAFERRLQELGWADGRNLRIDYRWSSGGTDEVRAAARELAGLGPDVMVGHRILPTLALAQASGVIPIVFTAVGDPIYYGLVESLARPGRNVTGFTNFAPTLGAKLLALLKEMAPQVTRAAVMFDPDTDPTSMAYAGAAAAAAKPLAVESVFAPVYAPAEIESAIAMLGQTPGGGLIVPPNDFTTMHRKSLIALAARYRLPAIYGLRQFAAAGGLMSYGIDPDEQFRSIATYVDRIFKGERPAELAVQAPTKFELAINRTTAQALGLGVPPALLARADEVIE